MKKKLFLIPALLLLISTSLSCTASPRTVNDMIIAVDQTTFLENSEKDVMDYYKEYKDDIHVLSDYMMENQMLFSSLPVAITREYNELPDIGAPENIQGIARRLIIEGLFKAASTSNGDVKDVHFYVNAVSGVYEQGIRYVSDPQIIAEDKSGYIYIKEYTDLGDGWYYYLYYYNKVKDEDIYKKIIWDEMGEKVQNTVIGADWHSAIVTLVDWSDVYYKADDAKRDFVVCVTFYTDQDGFLGPIVRYLDPVTREIVGGEMRF